jgi:hypothetical protein
VITIRRFPRLFVLILFFISFSSFAQIGGNSTYDFLSRTNSARVAALGGDFLTVKDNDLSLVLANPSLISAEMNNNLALDYVNLRTGFNYGDIIYSRTFSKIGSFAGAFQFISYGKFKGADESGNLTGEFSAAEYALNIGWGRQLSPLFSIGANGKLIYSQLENYNSFGIAVDVAGSYTSKEGLFTASLIGRNIGIQIVPYIPGHRDPLPFEMQAGISTRLKHIPLRISVLYNNIEKWDLAYTDPNDPDNIPDPITGEKKSKSGISKFADNCMRHIVLGTELTIAKTLSLRLGYNYKTRQEMKLPERKALSGFSFGAGLRIKMFSFSYTRLAYQPGNLNPNYLTFAMNLDGFKKKAE